MAKADDPHTPADENEEFRDSTDLPVDQIHQRIVSREQVEPDEGFEPTPAWVWVISVLFLFAMGFYLGRYSGSWSTVAHEVESPLASTAAPVKRTVDGSLVYTGVCQTCHQSDGSGVSGQYPPLTASEWVLADAETPVRIVLYGLEGPITVKGSVYNNKMPQFYDKLADDEIAAVVNHIRSSWGNSADPVDESLVASIRAEHGSRLPWSATELQRLRPSP